MDTSLVREPSGALPIAMSLTALLVVVAHVALFGIVHEADEGTAAHLWQLLMGGQLPIVAWFALKWLPRAPRRALRVLALQIAAMLPSFAAVYFCT
jgi:ABC-type Co2+ transport system permease subunit